MKLTKVQSVILNCNLPENDFIKPRTYMCLLIGSHTTSRFHIYIANSCFTPRITPRFGATGSKFSAVSDKRVVTRVRTRAVTRIWVQAHCNAYVGSTEGFMRFLKLFYMHFKVTHV